MKTFKIISLIVCTALLCSLALEPAAFAKKGGAKKSYEKHESGTPPGWSRGKKTGWGGGKYPPGWSKWDEKKKQKWVYDRDEAQSEINGVCVRYRIDEQKRNQISEAFDQAIVGGMVIADSKDKLVSALKNGTSRKKIVADTFEAVHDILD